MLRRRAEIAFGLLSIAIVRLIRAHPGLNWAGSMPGEGRHGRARKETRDSNGAETRVRSDFVFATIQDGPFIEFDNRRSRPSAGGDKRRHMILSVSLSRVTGVLEDRSTQPSPRSRRQFGHAERDQDHYRSIGAFGKMQGHCTMNATESQQPINLREVSLTKGRL